MLKGVVLLGLPHVTTTLQNRLPGFGGLTEGFFLLQLPHGSQLLASASSSSSLTQSRLDFPSHLPSVYRTTAIYRHFASLHGSADGTLSGATV